MTNHNDDTDAIKWKGEKAFYIFGTDHSEDTIRIEGDSRKEDHLMTLVLPTLCVTYADMEFANDIDGMQKDYPESTIYGPKYFDPPLVIEGKKEIEKFTWIRGAKRVTIGPEKTIIEWWKSRTLVIPKLRIKAKEKALVKISVPETTIHISQPFTARIKQYADGRHIGGIQFTKRHPKCSPQPTPEKCARMRPQYGLWVRVIDGHIRRGISKANIRLYSYDTKEKTGRFVLESEWYTDKMGVVDDSSLACSDKKLLTIEHGSYLPHTWRFRPLPDQKVKRTFKLWQSKQTKSSYEWRVQDTLKDIAKLTGSQQITILRMNHMHSANELNPGKTIEIPCFEAVCHVENRDTLEHLADRFCYNNVEELATANKLSQPYKLYQDQELCLPGWRFFKARSDELFEKLNEQFGIPNGWSRPVQRTLHDDPTRAYEHEIVAVPTQEFIQKHKLRRIY